MQIVIDIPKEVKNRLCFGVTYPKDIQVMCEALNNGIPLPKGHGRLIDADNLDVISYQHTSEDFDNGVMWLAEQIDNAPIIIEADTAESEEV